MSIKKIIKAGLTTRGDLEKLLSLLGLDEVQVNWYKDYNPKISKWQILNLGNNIIGGTHWVAVSPIWYFDPFGLPPPPRLTKKQYVPLQVQSIRSGHCGTYCVLFLWYVKTYGSTAGPAMFYSEFNIDVDRSGPLGV